VHEKFFSDISVFVGIHSYSIVFISKSKKMNHHSFPHQQELVCLASAGRSAGVALEMVWCC
jgi:hypothetical protein